MISLVKQDYNENRKLYERVENKLRKKISEDVPITHVGSTAIPSILYGKNIIDILIGAKDKKQFDDITATLISDGYVPSQKSKDEIYQFFSSIAGETGSGDTHIHLVVMGTERYSEFIILRDYLINNEEEATRYSNLKKEIIDKGITDRKEYKAVKSPYVTELLIRAKKFYLSSM